MSQELDEQFANWSELADIGEFEAAMEALEASVALLEEGGLTLSAMTECYELGLRLSRRCSELLRDAELRITVLEQSFAQDEAVLSNSASLRAAPLLDLDE